MKTTKKSIFSNRIKYVHIVKERNLPNISNSQVWAKPIIQVLEFFLVAKFKYPKNEELSSSNERIQVNKVRKFP